MTKRKILVVDDEASLTRMLKLNLEETGKYEVRTENHGAGTMNTALEFRPDLILLDIMMPDMPGSDVAEEILKNRELKDTKIIFLTALVSKQEAEVADGKIAGRSFVAKPAGIEELVQAIEKEFEGKY